ncbi:Uncharacterised protein [Mycobacteroides abscessus subsp. abscessus]|nr:Uncharacterised protein [Mycobacteroides abscessus subsp. abscessus]
MATKLRIQMKDDSKADAYESFFVYRHNLLTTKISYEK